MTGREPFARAARRLGADRRDAGDGAAKPSPVPQAAPKTRKAEAAAASPRPIRGHRAKAPAKTQVPRERIPLPHKRPGPGAAANVGLRASRRRPGTAACCDAPRACSSRWRARPRGRSPSPRATSTSPSDIAAVKRAIEFARKGKDADANAAIEIDHRSGRAQAGRMGDTCAATTPIRASQRFAAFIAANPAWPHVPLFRRRAENALWDDRARRRHGARLLRGPRADHRQRPLRRWRARCSRKATAPAPQALVRKAWRDDDFSRRGRAHRARQVRRAADAAPTTRRAWSSRFYDDDAGRRHARRRACSAATTSSIARARMAVIKQSRTTPRRCSTPCPAADAAATPGYIFSKRAMAAPRRQDRRSRQADADRADAMRPRWSISTNGGSSAACWCASCSTTTTTRPPTGSRAMPPPPPRRTTASTSISPPAGSRCASCTIRRPPPRISRASPKAPPIRITLARGDYWQGRAAEALGQQRRRAHIIRPPRNTATDLLRPARARAAWPGRTRPARHAAVPPEQHARADESRSRARGETPLCARRARLDRAVLRRAWRKRHRHRRLAMLCGDRAQHNDARSMLLIGKARASAAACRSTLMPSRPSACRTTADRAAGRAGA